MPKSDNNKDNNVEEAVKITLFLVPLIWVISIFIVQAAEYASSVQSYLTLTGFWKTFLNNPLFIISIIAIILSWLFLIIYYFTERTERCWLFISGFIAGLPILLLDLLVFFPNVFGLHLVTYSNFLYQSTAPIIFVVILLAIIIYWICLYKAIKAPRHKPFMDRQQKILEIHSLIGHRDAVLLASIALFTIGAIFVTAALSTKTFFTLALYTGASYVVAGLIFVIFYKKESDEIKDKIDALGK